MQSTLGEEARQESDVPTVRLELPDRLVGPLYGVLETLVQIGAVPPLEITSATDQADVPAARTIRVSESGGKWLVESAGRREYRPDEEAALLCVQERLIEAEVRDECLLLSGSIVARGSQCVLIVGDRNDADALLAAALATLEFQPVSIGMAVLDARTLVPRPLPLTFHLDLPDQQALSAMGLTADDLLERVSPALFRPRVSRPAVEPTHVLFLEVGAGSRSLVRPIAATAARTRLCHALVTSPEDQSPFAAVAAVMRHSRGIHLTLGDLPEALEQLSRLLPRWQIG